MTLLLLVSLPPLGGSLPRLSAYPGLFSSYGSPKKVQLRLIDCPEYVIIFYLGNTVLNEEA